MREEKTDLRRFEELNLSGESVAVATELGWTEPTPIQREAIPAALAGRDVVGIAQTGTGKTGAFALAIMERLTRGPGPRALILCPTRELAGQVAEEVARLSHRRALRVEAVYGGVPIGRQLEGLRRPPEILVATPGRLLDHLERGTVDLGTVQILVLDEADRMLDMGFRPQIEKILRRLPERRQTMLFSATMPGGVQALAQGVARDPLWIELAPRGTTAVGIEQQVYMVRPERKSELLLELLAHPSWDQVLVFTRTKTGADRLLARLCGAGIAASVLHSDRTQKDRTRALDHFVRGHVRVLVATDVAQRGLDVEGISHVVNYDVPLDPEDYVHRIGRTGRAGATGAAVTFVTPSEIAALRAIEHMLGRSLERVDAPEFGYGPALTAERTLNPRRPRGSRPLGTRLGEELSEERLAELLKVG
ncbi:MAG: DEAD/DEAH box helicase [Gemmatimonadetes bacterium]|nr:DEAD/DEAH box helicase [Gemmatimonadota bacterium]